jgi:hypothetical protein
MMYAELWVKLVGKCVWMAMALAVPTRPWLGGVISPRRDRALITALVQKIWACARSLAILVCVDGLASYVTAFLRVFRDPLRRGRRGRPRLVVESDLLIIHHVQGCTYSSQVINSNSNFGCFLSTYCDHFP